jgi:hypothetical protein
MSETSNAPASESKAPFPPAPPVAPKKIVSDSFRFEFMEGLRDEMTAEVDGFNPPFADPAKLATAKRTAKEMIEQMPSAARGCRVMFQCNGIVGREIVAHVTPTLIKKSD